MYWNEYILPIERYPSLGPKALITMLVSSPVVIILVTSLETDLGQKKN